MPSLQEAYERFVNVDRSSFTKTTYSNLLVRMVNAVGPVRDVSRVTVEDIEDWFYPTINRKPLKRGTAAEYLSVVRRFFNFCLKRGYIQASPCETIHVRHDEDEPRISSAVSPADLRRMVDYARATSPRNYAILLFFVVTGCRTGGITSLTLPNLYLDQQRARIKEKGSRWVWVRFGPATTEALRAWLEVRPKSCNHDSVFTATIGHGAGALTRHGFRSIVENISLKMMGYRIRPHKLRHARGHSLAWKGIPESITGAVLNHRSSESTRIYYPNDDVTVDAIIREYELAALEDVEVVKNITPLVS